ncbi:transposon Tf2-6 polyprotein [Nephila pilipes]|uniref:Transposon Tf2-6 polyprotein n=1 Tax=Nephila pilipes TaxID=299642 RepID=A0A8X6NMB1_NEPPI|nr:transposon Tf2-6 polyprotein [Nephila pilipes]
MHIDFIGPFPPSNDQRLCYPFGYHALVVLLLSRQTNFESNLFRELSDLLGTNRTRCCAYHPKANGLVERLHRHLKSAIKAQENSKWSEIIPIVLLGMRSAVKKDINATCAELVYGTTLRLSSDLFSTDKFTTTCKQTYVSFLREKMRSLQPIPTSAHTKSSMFVPTDLKSCSHVFLRVDSVQPPLSQNYTGPHEVVQRIDKVFTILINGK